MSDDKKTNWLGIVQTTATVAAAMELNAIKKTLAAQTDAAKQEQRLRTQEEMSKKAQEDNKSYRRSSALYEQSMARLDAESQELRKSYSPELRASLDAIDAKYAAQDVAREEARKNPPLPVKVQAKEKSGWLLLVLFAVGYVAVRHYFL